MAMKQSLLVSCFCVLQLAVCQDVPPAHVRNFGKVNDHLYRGAEPGSTGLEELGAMGFKVDIDLREAGPATAAEKTVAERLGMRYINIPLPPFSAPPSSLVDRVLLLLNGNSPETVFLHCRRGKDRTGTMIACYRIEHDGWANQRALDEANRYGMSRAERGMRSYVIHFAPQSIPVIPLVPATPLP